MNMENNSWTIATVVVASILVCIVIVIGILGNLMVVLVTIKGNRIRTKGACIYSNLGYSRHLSFNKSDLHACCMCFLFCFYYFFVSSVWDLWLYL